MDSSCSLKILLNESSLSFIYIRRFWSTIPDVFKGQNHKKINLFKNFNYIFYNLIIFTQQEYIMKVLAKSWNHFQRYLFLRCIIDHDLHIPQTFPKILSEAVDILKQIILFTHFSEKDKIPYVQGSSRTRYGSSGRHQSEQSSSRYLNYHNYH